MSTHFWNIFKVSELASTFWRNCAAFETALRTETHVLAASGLALSEKLLEKAEHLCPFFLFHYIHSRTRIFTEMKNVVVFYKNRTQKYFCKNIDIPQKVWYHIWALRLRIQRLSKTEIQYAGIAKRSQRGGLENRLAQSHGGSNPSSCAK